MPLIEELPVSNPTRISHGWAYVPDVAARPIAAMAQPNSRKRNRNDAGTTNATATAKQQKANLQRLDSLGRENWKDGVTIPIPPRQGGKERKTKMSANVRRILNYQKAFTHYLADEEAAMAAGGTSATYVASVAASAPAPATSSTVAAASAMVMGPPDSSVLAGSGGKADGRRKSSLVAAAAIESSRGGRRKSSKFEKGKKNQLATDGAMDPPSSVRVKQEDDTTTADASSTSGTSKTDVSAANRAAATSTAPAASTQTPQARPPYDPSYDTNPLLRTLDLPKMPTRRVLQVLVSEPPLSYLAARAKPLPAIDILHTNSVEDEQLSLTARSSQLQLQKANNSANTTTALFSLSSKLKAKPARHFCALCGYWGKVKCRKCGEWTCGLMECWRDHEGVCAALGMY